MTGRDRKGIRSISVTDCSDNISSNLYPQSRCHKSAWKTLTNDFSGGGGGGGVVCESSALALPISKWAVQVNTSEKVVQQPSVPSQTVFLFLSCFSWHWQNILTQATHTKYKCLKHLPWTDEYFSGTKTRNIEVPKAPPMKWRVIFSCWA